VIAPGDVEPFPQCPGCGGAKRTAVLGTGASPLDVVRCDLCGLVAALGRRDTAVLDAGYGERAATHDAVDRARKRRNVELYDRLVDGEITRPRPGARALDLGCNTGLLLDVLAEIGYATEGVERSPGARAVASASHLIHDLDLEDPRASTGTRYALVTITHVLEHMRDPVTVARFIARHLAPSGLGVVEVPNWDDIAAPLWGRRYRPLELGDHVSFFDRDTLVHVLERAGLEVAALWSRPQGATLVMPSLLTALDLCKGALARLRGARGRDEQGAMAARTGREARASGGLRRQVLRGLDRLDPWLDRVTAEDSRAGANLVAIVRPALRLASEA
jgi:SAM-dependent methyltransferase